MNKFMKLFNKKEKKNENKGTGNDIIKHLALQKALEELKEQKNKNDNLQINIMVLQNTINKIKEICKESKTSKIAKAILKELGE